MAAPEQQQQHGAAGRYGAAVGIEILCDIPCYVRAGRLEAQRLVDGPVQQRTVLGHGAALVGMLGEHLASQPISRPVVLVARPGHHLG